MKRAELEHIIRAAAGLTNEREFVVVGAAALLGSVPEPGAELAQTLEADIYPPRALVRAQLIEPERLLDRIATLPVSAERREQLAAWLGATPPPA